MRKRPDGPLRYSVFALRGSTADLAAAGGALSASAAAATSRVLILGRVIRKASTRCQGSRCGIAAARPSAGALPVDRRAEASEPKCAAGQDRAQARGPGALE